MKKNIFLLLSALLCVSLTTGCNKEEEKNTVTITFLQYDFIGGFSSENRTQFYGELISKSVREFPKGYYLTKEEFYKIKYKLDYIVPELVGDGLYYLTRCYYDKELTDDGEWLTGDLYLTTDLTVYYGIYG
jgi:hypothetical protein